MEATSSTESVGSEQAGYVDDALGSGEQQAETPKSAVKQAETPNVAKQQPGQGAQKPQSGQPGQPEQKVAPKPAQEADPLDSIFTDDKGQFDADGFAEFSIPDAVEADEAVDLGEVTPDEPADQRPEWEKDLEERRTYETNLRSEVLDPLQQVADLIAQGLNPRQALEQVYAEREQKILKHLSEFQAKRDYERRAKDEERHTQQTQRREMVERSKTNTQELISQLHGKTNEDKVKLYNHVMFSKEIGSVILNREFMKRYPGIEKMSTQEKHQKADEFLQEITADKKELRYFFERAYDRSVRLKLPSLMQRMRIVGSAQEKEQRLSAQKHPAGPYKRQSPKGGDMWENYSNSHMKYMDRV